MRSLIICEKNDAAKQIAKTLSGGKQKLRRGAGVPAYELEWDGGPTVVIGLRGHVLETDFEQGHERWSIKPDKLHGLIDAPVQKVVTEEKIVKALREEAERADRIVVATDYDREGELIGVEALDALGKAVEGKEVRRAKYSSFTKKEVDRAFSGLQDVDRRLAAAGEARQVIDLAWGAALTRYVSIVGGRRGRDFLSVGRVQTPTLGIIVDREKEILAFRSDPYWEVHVDLGGEQEDAKVVFRAGHERNGYRRSREGGFDGYEGHFASEAEARTALERIEAAGQAKVLDVEHKETTRKAPIPFSTTGFQQAASGLGYGVKRAMDIAQKLYLNGFISYHRTENTVYPATLEIDELLEGLARGGPVAADTKWVQGHRRPEPTRGKKETTDHPPIYPTAVPGPGDKLTEPERRVWELVARRFLATLSPDARVHQVSALLDAGGERLRASGQTTIEAGWRRVYPYAKSTESPLPPLEAGRMHPVEEAVLEGKETQPPKRYGQGSLIAEMERLGIGTKATRHETIQKLIDRGYITEEPVQPTTVGFAVTDALEKHAERITEAEMTARLEAEMTRIEEGHRTLEETVADSRTLLHQIVEELLAHQEPIKEQVRAALEEDAYAGVCTACGEKLLVRTSRFGSRFIGCKGYPDCRNSYNLPKTKFTFRDEPCDECSAPVILTRDRGGEKTLCVNADCPSRKALEQEERQELGTCPTCKEGTLVATRSRNFKRYVTCDNDACDQTYPLPQRGAVVHEGEVCEHCGSPRVKIVTKGRKPWDICINMECPGKEAEKAAKEAQQAEKAAEKTG